MHILITHGYLLSGTGSNLYVANLVNQWRRAGHHVTVVCQEPEPMALEFVDEAFELDDTNELLRPASEPGHADNAAGICRVVRPDLGGLLPVYVYDHYEGFIVKEFPDCSQPEIEDYVARNRTALTTVIARWKPDVIQTNHMIMFPFIVGGLSNDVRTMPHVVTVHGSALNFSVRRDPRLVPFAREGLSSAQRIVVDSQFARAELEEFLKESDSAHLVDCVSVIPAGVDVDRFTIASGTRQEALSRFRHAVAPATTTGLGRSEDVNRKVAALEVKPGAGLGGVLRNIQETYDYRHVDTDVAERLDDLLAGDAKLILFVGKYLWTKGLHLLLLALPMILGHHPDAKLVLVGFGPFREIAEYLVACLSTGDLDAIVDLATEPPAELAEDGRLPWAAESLEAHREELAEALRTSPEQLQSAVAFTGILDHSQLRHLLPTADVLVAPSVFPEAFGMVAVEALAAGVYPVVTDQSAFGEIVEILQSELGAANPTSVRVRLDEEVMVNLATAVTDVLAEVERRRADGSLPDFRRELRKIAERRFSWKGIAQQFLVAYSSLVDDLPKEGDHLTERRG